MPAASAPLRILPLVLLSSLACGPSRPPAPLRAPTPAAPKPGPTTIVVCGERVSVTTDDITCVGAGIADLDGLRHLPGLARLTLDDQSLPALWKLDDATLARVKELEVKSVPLPASIPFYELGTPVVKAEGMGRLRNLTSLRLMVHLEDPSVLRGLTRLRELALMPTRKLDAAHLAGMHDLRRLNVSSTPELEPLRELRSLEVLLGVHDQQGACEMIGRHPHLRELGTSARVIDCPAIAGLAELKTLTISLPKSREKADAAIRSIAKLKQVRHLTLLGAEATLSPLAALPNLVELVSHSGSADLKEVGALRHLERLEWHGPGNVEHLAGLPKLRKLKGHGLTWGRGASLPMLEVVETGNYGDVASLLRSPRLREASLGQIRGDVSALAHLTELRHLSFRLTSPQDLSPLASLLHLEKLDVSGHDGSLAWLEGMSKLRELFVSGFAVRADTLPASLSLDVLSLRGVMGPNILLPAIRVEKLILSSEPYRRRTGHPPAVRIRSLQGLTRVRGLKELVLEDSAVRSLAPLEGHTQLERIDVENAPITSLEPLRGKPLRDVDIASTMVTDLSPLAETETLRNLSVADTAVDDLRPVAKLPALVFLNASMTPMSHVGQLVATASLYYLNIFGTGVHDVAPLARRESLRFLNAPMSVTSFVALADLPLIAVSAIRFDCASEGAVPFVSWGDTPTCTEPEDFDDDQLIQGVYGEEDAFDEDWGGR